MVRGQLKSRTTRRVFVKTPGGRTVTRYVYRKPGRARCGITGQFLHGISATRKNQNKTQKTVARAFGGTLSSLAARSQIKMAARMLNE